MGLLMRWRRLMRTPLRWWGVLLVLVGFWLAVWLCDPYFPAVCALWCVVTDVRERWRCRCGGRQ